MLKYIFIGILLIFMYVLYASLMKAAGKKTPLMPDIKHDEDKDN